MASVKKEDYENIINIFNESGDKATKAYISNTYGNKDPRGVIYRIKNTPGYKYDSINKKIIKSDGREEKIFMNLEELCNNTEPNKIESSKNYSCGVNNIESLYIELMQEKLLELMKYIKLNHCTSTISINKSAIIADGYKFSFN